MDLRLLTAVSAAKLLRGVIRLSGGGATAAPGLLAEYIDPKSLKKLGRYFKEAILITGTNGKTTTARLLGNIFREAEIPFIHNRTGSNLLRGLIGTLTENVGFLGNARQKLALLEVDELTLPSAIHSIEPKIILFNNLFRDQLDRYGEVDKIRRVWQGSLVDLDLSTILVLNSDDHSVAHLADSTKAKAVYFGIEDGDLSLGRLPHASDFTSCISCGNDLRFDQVYLSHLGKYRCAACGLKRPKPDVYAKKVNLDGENGFTAEIITPIGKLQVKVGLPGIYNVYNTLAAVSASVAYGIELGKTKKALSSTVAAFGRTEKIKLAGSKRLFIALVKNPSGFNEIIRLLSLNKNDKYLLIAINDLIADGRDVSWLWDVDFEKLFVNNTVKRVRVSGLRAKDMALRLKYAANNVEPQIEEDLSKALELSIEELPKGETLYIMPTYTAMLNLKKILFEKGYASRFWED